ASVRTDRDRILLVVEIRPSRRTPHRLCGRSGPAAPFRTDTTRIAYPVGRFGRASLSPSLFYGAHQEVRPPQEAPAGRGSRPASSAGSERVEAGERRLERGAGSEAREGDGGRPRGGTAGGGGACGQGHTA